jgi:hypothetical protein
MELRPEALAILQVFKDKGCKEDDFVHYTDFGDAIIWEAGFIKLEETRCGLRELIDGQYVIEHSAGLAITASGLNALS